MPTLFDPVALGALTLANRIIMAPLTRGRAGESRVPNDLMATYYAQRAQAGLIVAEATAISPIGYGWKNAPALYTDAQQEGWSRVTKAVHDAGGKIVLQLWHMGRVSHPDLLDGATPLAPSAIAAEGVNRSLGAEAAYVTPRAMTVADIQETIADYGRATQRAMAAGFDGVEIHGANGYLIDQFLHDGSNHRTDAYGGTADQRARFLREVIAAVTAVAGADRTGLRLSPVNGYNSMYDSTLQSSFVRYAEIVDEYGLAYLHLKEPVRDGDGAVLEPHITKAMRAVYKGPVIVNDGYDGDSAARALSDGYADAVAFGRAFIANPDLPTRLQAQAQLNTPQMDSFYTGGAQGYTDYPALQAA